MKQLHPPQRACSESEDFPLMCAADVDVKAFDKEATLDEDHGGTHAINQAINTVITPSLLNHDHTEGHASERLQPIPSSVTDITNYTPEQTETSAPLGSNCASQNSPAFDVVKRALDLSDAEWRHMKASWSISSLRHYECAARRWIEFSEIAHISPTAPTLAEGIGFLQYLKDKGWGLEILLYGRRLLSLFARVDGVKFGNHPEAINFMREFKKERGIGTRPSHSKQPGDSNMDAGPIIIEPLSLRDPWRRDELYDMSKTEHSECSQYTDFCHPFDPQSEPTQQNFAHSAWPEIANSYGSEYGMDPGVPPGLMDPSTGLSVPPPGGAADGHHASFSPQPDVKPSISPTLSDVPIVIAPSSQTVPVLEVDPEVTAMEAAYPRNHRCSYRQNYQTQHYQSMTQMFFPPNGHQVPNELYGSHADFDPVPPLIPVAFGRAICAMETLSPHVTTQPFAGPQQQYQGNGNQLYPVMPCDVLLQNQTFQISTQNGLHGQTTSGARKRSAASSRRPAPYNYHRHPLLPLKPKPMHQTHVHNINTPVNDDVAAMRQSYKVKKPAVKKKQAVLVSGKCALTPLEDPASISGVNTLPPDWTIQDVDMCVEDHVTEHDKMAEQVWAAMEQEEELAFQRKKVGRLPPTSAPMNDTNERYAKAAQNFPPQLRTLVDALKAKALAFEGGLFFDASVNTDLLDLGENCLEIPEVRRDLVYSHLAEHLPCSKVTLLNYVRILTRMRDTSHQRSLQTSLVASLEERLKAEMPALEERHNWECLLIVKMCRQQEAFIKRSPIEDPDDTNTQCDPAAETAAYTAASAHFPKRSYVWSEPTRRLVWDIMKLKLNRFADPGGSGKVGRLVSLDELRDFARQHVVPAWPAGWMDTDTVIAEYRKMQQTRKQQVQYGASPE